MWVRKKRRILGPPEMRTSGRANPCPGRSANCNRPAFALLEYVLRVFYFFWKVEYDRPQTYLTVSCAATSDFERVSTMLGQIFSFGEHVAPT